jgi:hypothetical protein
MQRGRKSGYAPVGMTLLLGIGMLVPKQNCHPDRSVAQWRDLLFLFALIKGLNLGPFKTR